jgi:hypothetical protein
MSISSCAWVLAIAAPFLITQAEANHSVATKKTWPADTDAFVASCAADMKDCREAVDDVINYYQMEMYFGRHGCNIPGGNDRTGTPTIITWLNANSATRAPKTDDAIAQAMEALWPDLCKH